MSSRRSGPYWLAIIVASGAFITACREPLGVAGVEIRTDQLEYSLQEVGTHRQGTIEVTVTNTGARPLYLHRLCGTAEEPASRLVRPVEVAGENGFSGSFCPDGISYLPPIRLSPGASLVDHQLLSIARSRPLKEWTGSFEFRYDVQLTDHAGPSPENLLTVNGSPSNQFSILVPDT